MATTAQRAHMLNLMKLLLAHEPQIHYPLHDVRTSVDLATFKLSEQQLTTLLSTHKGDIQADCSEMTTEICRWAGLRDPNGLNYARAGFTGTMLASLPHYSDQSKAAIGALVVFGPGTGQHVAMVMEPGTDPLLFSHGSEAGPRAIRLSDERTGHSPPVTFLSIMHL